MTRGHDVRLAGLSIHEALVATIIVMVDMKVQDIGNRKQQTGKKKPKSENRVYAPKSRCAKSHTNNDNCNNIFQQNLQM
eukprot:scaffold426679_cov17-Prasinocladus_malaysianus.AAC.1